MVLLPAGVAMAAVLQAKTPLQSATILSLFVGADLGLAAVFHRGVADTFAIWHAPVLHGLCWWVIGWGLEGGTAVGRATA